MLYPTTHLVIFGYPWLEGNFVMIGVSMILVNAQASKYYKGLSSENALP